MFSSITELPSSISCSTRSTSKESCFCLTAADTSLQMSFCLKENLFSCSNGVLVQSVPPDLSPEENGVRVIEVLDEESHGQGGEVVGQLGQQDTHHPQQAVSSPQQ